MEQCASANPEKPTGTPTKSGLIQPGQQAPAFTLPTTPDQKVSLDDYQGQPVVLAFYPADWSPVCSDELALFNETLPEFRRLGAGFLGVSVDGVWCHNEFAKQRKYHFPLLSDFEPKGEVAKQYGAYRQKEGVCERALVLIDADGKVAWSYRSPIGVNPGVDGVLRALESLPGRGQKKEAA